MICQSFPLVEHSSPVPRPWNWKKRVLADGMIGAELIRKTVRERASPCRLTIALYLPLVSLALPSWQDRHDSNIPVRFLRLAIGYPGSVSRMLSTGRAYRDLALERIARTKLFSPNERFAELFHFMLMFED